MKRAMVWRVPPDGTPVALRPAQVDFEKRLEDWIEADVSIAVDDVLVIGRQLNTDWGTTLDLLGVDGEGNLVVLELKRKQTLRDTVAQGIEYAAWVSTLGYERIAEILTAKFGSIEAFEAAFLAKFHVDPPDSLNGSQRIIVVAPEIDPVTVTVIGYLSRTYQMPINAAWFDIAEGSNGELLVVRLTVVEDEQARQRPPRDKRAPAKTLDELRAMAEENGVADVFDELMTLRQDVLPSLICYQSNLNLRTRALDGNGYLAGLSITPHRSGFDGAVDVAISLVGLPRLSGRSADDVAALATALRSFLTVHPSNWQGWERYGVKSTEQASRVVKEVRRFFSGTDAATASVTEPVEGIAPQVVGASDGATEG